MEYFEEQEFFPTNDDWNQSDLFVAHTFFSEELTIEERLAFEEEAAKIVFENKNKSQTALSESFFNSLQPYNQQFIQQKSNMVLSVFRIT